LGFQKGKIVSIDLNDAVTNIKELDPDYLRLAKILA
jgi:6-phosphofructokinase 1